VGLYFATLPLYYSTYWDAGVPYYYADNTYYAWDRSANEYQTVSPPADVQKQAEAQMATTEPIAYPKNGQSSEQQATDKSECRQWASTQAGQTGSNQAGSNNGSDFMRAQVACLTGRGYSVQ